jgi:hypothetical protein
MPLGNRFQKTISRSIGEQNIAPKAAYFSAAIPLIILNVFENHPANPRRLNL